MLERHAEVTITLLLYHIAQGHTILRMNEVLCIQYVTLLTFQQILAT